jgi:hypothetical protein
MNEITSANEKQLLQESGIANPSARLRQAIIEDSNRATDWQWYFGQLHDPAERIYCLQRILHIDPADRGARTMLNKLKRMKQPAEGVAYNVLRTSEQGQGIK